MSKPAVVYLVGGKGSVEANSFLHITNDKASAEALLAEIPEGEIKEVQVKGRHKAQGGSR